MHYKQQKEQLKYSLNLIDMEYYFQISVNNIFEGEVSFGFYTQSGINENKKEFYEVIIGILIFEFSIGKLW